MGPEGWVAPQGRVLSERAGGRVVRLVGLRDAMPPRGLVTLRHLPMPLVMGSVERGSAGEREDGAAGSDQGEMMDDGKLLETQSAT